MDRPAQQQSVPKLYRISTLREFLPLSSDERDSSLASARGSNMAGLIQASSATNLAGMRSKWLPRRNSISAAEMPALRQRSDSESSHGLDPASKSASHNPGGVAGWGGGDDHSRRMSYAAEVLMTPQVRSQRLIGNTNPRYRWEQYWKSEDQLRRIKKKSIRQYYERNNYLVQNYMYIDRLLDSSLPHDLIQEYNHPSHESPLIQGNKPSRQQNGGLQFELPDSQYPETIEEGDEEPQQQRLYLERAGSFDSILADGEMYRDVEPEPPKPKVKRTPKDIYSIKKQPSDNHQATEEEPLLRTNTRGDLEEQTMPPDLEFEDEASSSSRIVQIAIWVNLVANTALLAMKIVVVLLSSSVSVLASLVDAALDFLSTAIVGLTTWLISRTDQYAYPTGRRRLEPVGVLVFSVIMITAFIQVLWEALSSLTNGKHEVVELGTPAIAIMASTVVIKFACWLWCRLIKNSSVQALAQDAMTDVVFNLFSIIFPLIGFYARIWWLDPVGGIFLSLYVIINWSRTASEHITNLTGASASPDERNILLYLTMRFAKTIRRIQGLQAYHSGDKLNVEVDIVLDEDTSLRDSHDLGESLQYVIESVPNVDRAFVHMDYADYNLPSHMQQDS
ncbi:Metal tolerance 7 [Lecanosticta acicola]|uniref:Metal tolerance 7 n=1 Tax=Lecanosticta acicola TaxID=111012 RepID=A0AAI8YVZ0_9PEZI|nr:Metal tolerance 7 [Lecanosticta acicola]